jgi:hypothetical protein
MEKLTLTFNELRRIKDALPSGSSQKIAEQLSINVETVRNYFGGKHYDGSSIGVHFEQGPDGGIVSIDDPTILNLAKQILTEANINY